MGTSFKRSHTFPATLSAPTLQQATMTRLSAGDSWTCPGKTSQFLVDSLLLSHGSWCTQCSAYALQKSSPQSCVSSGSSMMGLMVTSSKRAYAIPRSTAPGAPAPTAVHCLPISTGDTHTQFSLSLCGVSGSQRVQGHFSFLVGMGFDSKCDFATPPPTPSSLWGFSFAFGSRLSPQSHSSTTQPPLKLLFHVKLQGL